MLKIGLFCRVKELSKSNQTWYGVSPMYLESKTKRIFAVVCLGKKLVFHTEISNNSLIIRLFYFQKYRNFIGSRSCSGNWVWSIPSICRVSDKKNFCYSLPRKKVSFSYGNLRISQITNVKNRSFLSGQGVVQIKPNSVWSIPYVPRV